MKTLRSCLTSWGVATLLSPLALLAGAPAWAQTAVKPGDVAAAQKKAAMCIGCHGIPGYQASFPEIHKVPMISGQNAKYIANALHAYQKGDRKHPTMKGVAVSLSDQDIADLAAYYEASGKDLPRKAANTHGPSLSEVNALLKKGECASCHGANLSTPIDPTYPKLGGQHADYLYVALKSYQTEGNAHIGRNNATMGPRAKIFTLPELKLLASYIESLSGDLKTVPQAKFKAHAR